VSADVVTEEEEGMSAMGWEGCEEYATHPTARLDDVPITFMAQMTVEQWACRCERCGSG